MPYLDRKSPAARASHARAVKRWRDKRPGSYPSRKRPFVGVDGEGGGTDALGRQHYLLLRAGDDVLFHDNRPLTSEECLAFLADLPTGAIYCAFFFDYDVTQILRDLSSERRTRLFQNRADRSITWIDWRGFQIDYLPRKYLKVRREGTKRWSTVSDAGTFFQCRFTEALERWQIGTPEERESLAADKARRDTFERMTKRELDYNGLECRLLAELMEAFRAACIEIGYVPRQWQGPGYLAVAMMAANGIQKKDAYQLKPGLLATANDAFYGGRFEVARIGDVGPVWSYDINSAYPRAMLDLPCLIHGQWKERRGRPGSGLWVADLKFQKSKGAICDLPVRTDKGVITWPREGRGTYWSTEVAAAERAGTRIVWVGRCWTYESRCSCVPFAWVREVYEERKRLGKAGKGMVLKLGLNSQYGKTAQSVGAAPYANPIWAGLITAHCRASIIDAYRLVKPESVVMIATDGLYTTEEIPWLHVTQELGDWDAKHVPSLFVIQPGLYFGAKQAKTRGVSRHFLEAKEEAFRSAWSGYKRGNPPSVTVPVRIFVGLKLATARNAPDTAGVWADVTKEIGFDWSSKRGRGRRVGTAVRTDPLPGSMRVASVPYRKIIGAWKEKPVLARLEFEAMPDFQDTAPG